MSAGKFKCKDRVYAICYTGVFPGVEEGQIIDTDFTVDPPVYIIRRDSNGYLFPASEEDVGATLEDLRERRIEVLRLAKAVFVKKIAAVERVLRLLGGRCE